MAEVQTDIPLIADEQWRDREETFGELPRDENHLVVCSDERLMTAESRRRLEEHSGIQPNVLYSRDFGGIHGIAADAAVAIVAQTGSTEVIEPFTGDFEGFVAQTMSLFRAANEHAAEGRGIVVPVDHSDEHNDHADTLDMDAETGLGCLYDKKIGTALLLEASNEAVQAVGRSEFQRTFGDAAVYDHVVEAAGKVYEVLFGSDPETTVTRNDIARLSGLDDQGKPYVAILAGDHAPVDEVVEIANYVPESSAAPSTELPAFVTDMTDVTRATIEAYHRLGIELDPRYLFGAKIVKRAAVRAALAGGDPERMATTVRGDGQAALAYVREQLGNNS
ncbi:MAG TPA: hypothetical protein VJP80_02230 [Candidatus Saccharimonadales bacterium]|nr:hypothetical protein [Candidatus Saccharimonadales bacterium]